MLQMYNIFNKIDKYIKDIFFHAESVDVREQAAEQDQPGSAGHRDRTA